MAWRVGSPPNPLQAVGKSLGGARADATPTQKPVQPPPQLAGGVKSIVLELPLAPAGVTMETAVATFWCIHIVGAAAQRSLIGLGESVVQSTPALAISGAEGELLLPNLCLQSGPLCILGKTDPETSKHWGGGFLFLPT